MSTLAVVEEILRETEVPMSVREIVERAGARLPSKSKTPDTVVARDLSMDIKKKGRRLALHPHSPGRYTLRALVPQAAAAMPRRLERQSSGARACRATQARSGRLSRSAVRSPVAIPPKAAGTRAKLVAVAVEPRPRTIGLIRRAEPSDHPWIVATGAEAYRDLGDYTRILPSWLEQPGVLAWIDQDGQSRGRGFAMLGFYTEDLDRARQQVIADLLALAVLPSFQRYGIGSRLLHHVIEVAERVAPSSQITHLRLTVAEDNVGAQRLYARNDFTVVDGSATYDRGQRALRMARPLERRQLEDYAAAGERRVDHRVGRRLQRRARRAEDVDHHAVRVDGPVGAEHQRHAVRA